MMGRESIERAGVHLTSHHVGRASAVARGAAQSIPIEHSIEHSIECPIGGPAAAGGELRLGLVDIGRQRRHVLRQLLHRIAQLGRAVAVAVAAAGRAGLLQLVEIGADLRELARPVTVVAT